MDAKKFGEVIQVESGCVDVLVTRPELTIDYAGRSYRLGQLGTYAAINMEGRTVIGFVTGSRRGLQEREDTEANVIIALQLLGEIKDGKFARGVNEYPIIGDDVRIAVREDFEQIFGSFDDLITDEGHPQSFTLGRFALSTDFEVRVLGSDFFAKHAAVVGNSGSGKSCTTTKILQEVLELSQSQVVLFDMHGEYRAAFCDEEGQLDANVTYLGVDDLVLPYWLLRYEEIERLFIDKSNPLNISTQISFLRTALLEYKQDAAEELGLQNALTLDTPIFFSMEDLKTYAENLNEARFVLNDEHLAFSQLAARSMEPAEQWKMMRSSRCVFNKGNPEGETPHPLYFGKLLGFIDQVDVKFNDRRYEFLMRPIEHGKKSRFFKEALESQSTAGQASGLMNHLVKLLTGRIEPRSNLTIVDLSGIPFEIVDVVVAVLTRLLFDLNFWTPPHQRHPILLAYEEAHNYIPRGDTGLSFAKKAVERVAKEGRKYGVSAMVISQRPSELSETVLSQCNSLVAMRLSNPEDQHYIAKVVSDHFSSLIEMLPILRSGEAFIIGDAVLMPMRTLVDLPERLPQSGNLDFFRYWSSYVPQSDTDEIIEYWRRQDRQMLNRMRTGDGVTESDGSADGANEPLNAEIPPTSQPAKSAAPVVPTMPGAGMPRARGLMGNRGKR